MKYRKLGDTGIVVSALCFGSLTMTPFQSDLSISDGAELIRYGFERGINFLDTAELYDNYGYIKAALKGIPRDGFVITTKSYCYSEEGAERSLVKALRDMDTDYVDIFLLHEQESEFTIKGHYEALEYLLRQRERGLIRAVGISTHRIAGVRGCCKYPELDVLHPIVNIDGIGILDGSSKEMVSELEKAKKLGKGIYGMKILGGGHLIGDVERAFEFANNLTCLDSYAVGMQSKEEIDCNISLATTGIYPEHLSDTLSKVERRLIVADYCIGCGNCVEVCNHGGIAIINGNAVPTASCILCGYCANYCPEFCIKVI